MVIEKAKGLRVQTTVQGENLVDVVRTYVLQTFPLARRRNISDDDNLLSSGVIDSLGVLEIVTFLQEKFSLEIEDDDLTPENFSSVRTISQFIERYRDAVKAAG